MESKSYIEITSDEAVQNFINKLETTIPKIKEVFENENKLFDQVGDESIWKSESQKKIMESYDLLKKDYEEIDKSLNSFLKLMKETYEAYSVYAKVKESGDN